MLTKKIKADIKVRLKPVIYENPSYEDRLVYQAGFKAGYRAAMTHKTNSLIRVYQKSDYHLNYNDIKEETDFVVDQVTSMMQVSKKELYSDCRFRKLAMARSIIMNLLRDLSSLSYPKIGEIMGGKDHSTIIHHIRLKRDKTRFWSEGTECWRIYKTVYDSFIQKFQCKNSLK